MTKKHFKALAGAIALIECDDTRKAVSLLIGEVCESLNKRFNWSIWYEACGVF